MNSTIFKLAARRSLSDLRKAGIMHVAGEWLPAFIAWAAVSGVVLAVACILTASAE